VFSPDGSLLALGDVAGGISLWNSTQTALLGTLPPALSSPSASSLTRGSSDGGSGSGVDKIRVRQLVFLFRSPLLVAVFSRGIAVYNILTLRCEWAAEIDVEGVTADPASLHWAAILGRVSSTEIQETQQTHHERTEQGIIVFKGAEEVPVAAWRVRRAARGRGGIANNRRCAKGTSLLFATPGSPLHAAAAGVTVPGASPLLVITGQREYAVAVQQGSSGLLSPEEQKGNSAAAAAAAILGRRDTFLPSTFGSVYGKSSRTEPLDGNNNSGNAQEAGELHNEVGERPAWASLFDAPSHALPPMGMLCPAFLELVVVPGACGSSEEEEPTLRK